MNKFTGLILLTSALVFSLVIGIDRACADVQETCGSDQAGEAGYSWCIDITQGSTNPDVLYYFHGAGGNEHSWMANGAYGPARDLLAQRGGAPIVISISFGSDWLLNEQPYYTAFGFRYHPALYQPLMNQIMPAMESRIGGLKGRRMLIGESMGGFNAAQLLTKNANLFSRVSLVCPALMTVGPYSSSNDINAYDDRHSPYVNRDWVNTMVGWFGDVYFSNQIWQNENPLSLVGRLNAQSPPLFVSFGQQDNFGFNEVGQVFATQAHAQGENVTLLPVQGGHCAFDAVSLGQFLAR